MGSTDVCRSVPLGEEDKAVIGMDNDGSRSLEVLEKGAPVGDVARAQHVERALARVYVVEVLGRPVHGQAFYALVLTGQHDFAARAILVHLRISSRS